MPGPFHGWLYLKDQSGVSEVINQARTAAYLANPDITIDGIDICDILDFGGCENYSYTPVCLDAAGGWVDLPGVNGNNLTIPDAANLDITGDITVIVRVEPSPDWTPSSNQMLVAKWESGTQRSWRIELLTTGVLRWSWSASGSSTLSLDSAANLSAFSVLPFYLAVAFDVDNGASGRTAYFWTSSNGLQWTALGAPATSATATSIFASTSIVEYGTVLAGTSQPFNGNVSAASIRSGIGTGGLPGGTEVFGFDRINFTGVAAAATAFTAETGQTVTINHSGGTPAVVVPYSPARETWEELTFETPDTDDAPWWNQDYPESAEALGFYVEEWTGLDDRHVTRQMTRTGRDRGGASPGVISNRDRVMKLNIFMFASSEEAMSYQFHWLAAILESVCSSCASDSILIRDYCGSIEEPSKGVVEMRDVALVEGLGWEADLVQRGSCFIRRASFTLAAGDPCMYLPEAVPVVTPIAADLGPGLLTADYSLTRSPARPSCSELPATTRQSYTWPSETAMGAKAPVVIFHNDDPEHAFPFRAIVYHDPGEIGVTPNPCGLGRLGEIYVRPMPPYSYLKWDVAGREIQYRDPTTGDWVESWFLLDMNDAPLQRYFALPCGGDHHLVLEPGTLAIERIGGTGNVFEWGGIIFSSPHYPSVELTVVERVSCS